MLHDIVKEVSRCMREGREVREGSVCRPCVCVARLMLS